jgi:uncharacterized hydrophobic protein (TIGR00271 family)
MVDSPDEFLGELRLGHQFTSAGQIIARGFTIVLGILFLLSDRVLAGLDGRAPLAGILAMIFLGLTVVNVVELLGGSGERGGTYALVQETLGGLGAFLTGWCVLAGSLALAVALVSAVAAQILYIFPVGLPSTLVTVILILALFILQLFQFFPRRIQQFGVLLVLMGLLGLAFLGGLPHINLSRYRVASVVNLGAMSQTLAWLAVSYIAFESMLVSRRQVRNANRYLPRALFVLLVVIGLGFTLAWWFLAGLPPQSADFSGALMARLSAVTFVPGWFIPGLGILVMLLAANRCVMTAVRQVHTFTLTGALPKVLRRMVKPLPMPVGVFGLPAVLVLPIVFMANVGAMIDLAAGLLLVAMIFVNVAAIHSRRSEPERRRSLVVPFSPLVPVIGIAINLVLVHSLLNSIWLPAVGWLLLGGTFYLVYARHQQVEAQEGEVVFGRRVSRNGKEHPYRILVPIGPKDERHLGLRLAIALAHQLDGEVIPLQVITVPDPLAIDEGRRISQERNALFHWSMQLANDAGIPIQPITRLARNVPEGIVDTAVEESCNLVLMTWLVQGENPETRIGQNLTRVAKQVPADVGVIVYRASASPDRSGDEGEMISSDSMFPVAGLDQDNGSKFRPGSILVPISGGPHAPLAFRLAVSLAREYDASITSVYVATPESTQEGIASGKKRINETIANIREQSRGQNGTAGQLQTDHPISIDGRVITAQSVVAGITQAGNEADLVMLGASEESLIDQVLFGSIPEQVAVSCSSPVVILKRYPGLPRLWLRRTWDALFNSLPTLTQEEQIEVYRNIHRGARPDVDFFVMIGLSTVIAAFGLLQSSSAAIIGAMLVAPFFSPLLAISLSIVQGNVHLLWLALESTVKGVALSIGLTILLALLVPTKTITPEIASRSLPSLFDLAVALASGAAGAYAIAREDVAAALPGVAIAAALVPPLGVVGIGLAMGDLELAGGGGLLFAANLIAIALAGSVTFLLLGFRPGSHAARSRNLRRGLLTAVLLFVLVAIPLGGVFIQSVHTARLRQDIQQTVTRQFETETKVEITSVDAITFDEEATGLTVTIPIYTSGAVPPSLAENLQVQLTKVLGRPVHVRLVVFSTIDASP